MRQAKQVEAELLAEVAAGKHQGSAMTLAQLLDEWLGWRESNGKPISPATLHNYRLTIETKIKPGLGHLPVAKVDARVLDRFYVALRKGGNARTGGGALSATSTRSCRARWAWPPAGTTCPSTRRCWPGRRRRATPPGRCPRRSRPRRCWRRPGSATRVRTVRAPGRRHRAAPW